MATTNMQVASQWLASDIPVYNYSSSTDIAANTVVAVDATNTVNNGTTNTGIGIVLPSTGGNPTLCIGVTVEVVKASQTGRVRTVGGIATVVCDGAVTANTIVDASASVAGRVAAHTAGKNSIGIALMTGADGDTIDILVCPAANA